MLYPVSNLTHVITPALHPILSERQDDKDFIYQKYIQVIKLLSLLGVFISVFCFWSSEEIVLLVFGNQWHEAAVCFRWLSLSVWAQMVASSAGAIYQSIGKTKLMFISGLVHVGISVFCILLGIQTGKLEQFSMIIACGFIAKFFVEYYFLIKVGFKKSLIGFFYNFLSDIIIFIILFIVIFLFIDFWGKLKFTLLTSVGLKFIFLVCIYIILLGLIKQWKAIKSIIFQ
jgi:PST family polysaccharide transporter